MTSPFAPVDGGVRVKVRLTPKAAEARLGGLVEEPDGAVALKAAVTAVPEGGKANAALIKMAAKAWKVPKTSVSVVAGAADRRKTLLVEGESASLLRRLKDWMGERDA